MSLFLTIVQIGFTGLITVALTGCHGKPEAGPAHIHSTEARQPKPGAPVRLISDPLITTEANQLTQFNILLDVKASKGTLKLELLGADKLDLQNTPRLQTIDLGASQRISLPISLTAAENGRYYLNIYAIFDNGEAISARNIALIIQVGADNAAVGDDQPETSRRKIVPGERIISLPAQETISNQ